MESGRAPPWAPQERSSGPHEERAYLTGYSCLDFLHVAGGLRTVPSQHPIRDQYSAGAGANGDIFGDGPYNNIPYNIKTDPAFTSSAVSRINVEIGWDTAEIHNTGSGSEFAATPAAGLPITANALTGSLRERRWNLHGSVHQGDSRHRDRHRPLAVPEARAAKQDATGAFSIQVPIKMTYKNFLITGTRDGCAASDRRPEPLQYLSHHPQCPRQPSGPTN